MLKTRIIPTLLHRDFGLVKGVRFDSRRGVGTPMQAVKVYNLRNVDELVFLDVAATREGRSPDLALVDELADECAMPLAVGGGIRGVDDVRDLLRAGADKVVIGTAASERPEVVGATARRFGAQCVVVAVDVRRSERGPEVWVRSGTAPTGTDPVTYARAAEAAGAGEILLTSIDHDGVMGGYDLETIAAVSAAVGIPVIASGGAGEPEHMAAAVLDAGADAVAAASLFHFTHHTPLDVREHLRGRGVPVRT